MPKSSTSTSSVQTPTLSLQVSPKQALALSLLDDPTIPDLDYGGGAGGGKSWLLCLWATLQCRKYPYIAIGLGRKELKRLEQTTLVTLLTEVHPMLGITDEDFNYNGRLNTLTYKNGSQIVLVDLAYMPTDPNYDRLGSLNLTHSLIEEGGELQEKAIAVFSSRKNRKLNQAYGLVGKTVVTCNPSQNFLRSDYDMFEQLGGGDSQKWENGSVELPDGQEVPAYKAFVKSLVTDNPFISRNYILSLGRLPEEERKRLLEGNWDYDTDPNQLITALDFSRALVDELPISKADERTAGADFAREGNDKTVYALLDKDTVADLAVPKISNHESSDMTGKNADEFIDFAQKHGVGYAHTGGDAVGVGAGVIDATKTKGFPIKSYKAGSAPRYKAGNKIEAEKANELMFNNLRSQDYWNFAQDLKSGKKKILKSLPHLNELKQDLLAHRYTINDKVVTVESKKDMKKRLGRSPDYSDAVIIAYDLSVKQTLSIRWL